MSTTTMNVPPDPNGRNERKSRRNRRERADGLHARDVAISHLARSRRRLINLFQRRVLDWLLDHGEAFIPNVADGFDTPPGIRRCFIGAAVRILAESRMIAPTGERRPATSGGRHACILECWRLAPGVDRYKVDEWKRLRPVPPSPPEDVVEP